jgi:sialic acid synthase SpsE
MVRTIQDLFPDTLKSKHIMKYKKNFAHSRIKIESKEISFDSPVFIVVEAGCNHMCNIALAKKMIDEAKTAGADAIKFQTYKAEKLAVQDSAAYWKYSEGIRSQLEYYKNLDKFGRDEYKELFSYASRKGIIAFSTPFDADSASMLNELEVPIFKIASCDLLDVRLLRHVAKFGKPMILSTGASTLEEIEKAINTVFNAGNPDLILMVCTLSYPTDNENTHLRRISSFREKFPDIIIGLSDHTPPDENMIIPSVAVALGARLIEKHYTLDKTMSGSGHSFSMEPEDVRKMVENIRLTETVLGSAEIKIYDSEQAARKNARRSLVASRDIKKGQKIVDDLIGIKRPAAGFSADLIDQVLGKTAKCDIKKDTYITFEQLE